MFQPHLIAGTTFALISLFSLLIAGCPIPGAPDVQGNTSQPCELVGSGYGTQGQTSVDLEKLVDSLEVPWGMGFLPDGDILVTERPGRVRLIENGALVSTPVLDVTVGEGGEGGLLGLAVDPQYPKRPYFYIYYTYPAGSVNLNKLERYTLSSDHRTATLSKVLIDQIPAGTFHNGGHIAFGPDGKLYIGTGDARNPPNAQNLNTPSGKILRVTSEGGIPVDNPIAGNPYFISGIRNTQGFDWLDSATMIVTDHGPSGATNEDGRVGGDEVTIAKKGNNLGWPSYWKCDEADGITRPILAWNDAVPPGGALIYRGNKIPNWDGSLLLGSLKGRHLQRIVLDKNTEGQTRVQSHEVYFQGEPPNGVGRIRGVFQSPSGDLYIATSNCDGRGTCPATKDAIYKVQ